MQPANATRTPSDPWSALRYVLDTDTVSAHEGQHPGVVARFAGFAPGAVATTAVTMFEQFRGRLAMVNRARDDATLQHALGRLTTTQAYFCDKRILSFDGTAATQYRSLLAQRIRISTQDLRVAAITLANDVVLVTRNRRDFEWVPGLRIEDWTVV